jgi:hypothetical protein
MASDRRRSIESIPDNYRDLLTVDQVHGLRGLESFGWSLLYVRRPKFAAVEVVLVHADDDIHAVLDDTGELEQNSMLRLRGDNEAATADLKPTPVQRTKEPRTSTAAPQAERTLRNEPIPTNCKTAPAKYLV